MPKAYLVAVYSEITDPDALAAYAKLAGPAVVADGGRLLARGGRVKSLEGGIEERILPIRLTPMTATCRVPPLSRVKLGIGWSRGVARDAEQ